MTWSIAMDEKCPKCGSRMSRAFAIGPLRCPNQGADWHRFAGKGRR